MEITINVGRYWKNCGKSYEPVTSHKILKNVLIESKNSKERYDLTLDLITRLEERLLPFSVLYINLDPKVECPEAFDANITYGSSKFSVPYNLKSGDGLYDDFTKCFTAVLNFHPELKVIMGIEYQNCEEKGFPTSIVGFLDLLRANLLHHPYDTDSTEDHGIFTKSLLNNIKEARNLFENDSTLEETLRIGINLPEWVELWKQKRKIWIDLSSCESGIQKMLIPVIFLNLLRFTEQHGSGEKYWHFHGVVAINEADEVFAPVPWERYRAHFNRRRYHWKSLLDKSIFLDPWVMLTKEQIVEAYGDPLFLCKSRLESYYHYLLLDEFRLRNIALFTGTSDKKNVHEFIPDLSQVRFARTEPVFDGIIE